MYRRFVRSFLLFVLPVSCIASAHIPVRAILDARIAGRLEPAKLIGLTLVLSPQSTTSENYEAVVNFSTQRGLWVTRRYSALQRLDVEGPAGAVEKVFGVVLVDYVTTAGQHFHAPDVEPTIPAELAGRVQDVLGLENAPVPVAPQFTPRTSTTSPFATAKLWVDPNSYAAMQVSAWQTTRPADATQIRKISTQPQARWANGGDATVPAALVSYVRQMQQLGKTPFLVVFQIPRRDCGGLASGGSTTPANYTTWVKQLVSTLGTTRAMVVLEPDALAGLDCLSAADQTTRYQLIGNAVTLFKNQGSAVYIDAGNPNWKSATLMASRLKMANIARADGFALNISNFCTTVSCQTYGNQISQQVGGKHYIIDTGRNGLGPNGSIWCNPPGRALGPRPTTITSDPLCDAYEWIKPPGMSDGACNGGPSWGWWADYALGLCQRAAY